MDKLERKLRQDAEEIRPTLAPEVSARLMARIGDTPQVVERPKSGVSWWLASSLTGVAAAAVAVAILNWNAAPSVDQPGEEFLAQTVPNPQVRLDGRFPLELQRVVLTDDLEIELQNLESDLDKARDTVRRDVMSAF